MRSYQQTVPHFVRRVAALVMLGLGGLLSAHAGAGQSAEPALTAEQRAQVEEFDVLPRVEIPVESGGAQVVVVEFNDFQCPPCARAHGLFRPVFEKWAREAPGRVKLVVKDFPLELECNPNVRRDLHPAACDAAVAVRLARRQNYDVALAEWFYANQPLMAAESVRTAARDLGRVSDFDARYRETLDEVKADVAMGAKLGVRGTPTFFVNGVKLNRYPTPVILDAIIARELRKHGGPY